MDTLRPLRSLAIQRSLGTEIHAHPTISTSQRHEHAPCIARRVLQRGVPEDRADSQEVKDGAVEGEEEGEDILLLLERGEWVWRWCGDGDVGGRRSMKEGKGGVVD